jgi:hypothetical protein
MGFSKRLNAKELVTVKTAALTVEHFQNLSAFLIVEVFQPAVQVGMFVPVEDFGGIYRLFEVHRRNVFFGFVGDPLFYRLTKTSNNAQDSSLSTKCPIMPIRLTPVLCVNRRAVGRSHPYILPFYLLAPMLPKPEWYSHLRNEVFRILLQNAETKLLKGGQL